MPNVSSLARATCRHFLGRRMLAGRMLDKPVFIRELLPQDPKVEIQTLSRGEAMSVAEFLAHIVGRGHARQMAMADCRQWRPELRKNRSKSLDVPSWLWNSVVELVAAHEAACLNHCRRYAIADAGTAP